VIERGDAAGGRHVPRDDFAFARSAARDVAREQAHRRVALIENREAWQRGAFRATKCRWNKRQTAALTARHDVAGASSSSFAKGGVADGAVRKGTVLIQAIHMPWLKRARSRARDETRV